MQKITQEYLKSILHYDPDSGIWAWRISTNNRALVGSRAGFVCKKKKYRKIMVLGRQYYSSRLAWLYMEGYIPENEIDHINRNATDDRWCNLRHVSHRCNMRNRKVLDDSVSSVSGVTWFERTGKWIAQIKVDGKRIWLGYHVKLLDAARARWEAEKKYNFPNCNTTSSAYQYLQGNL